ncbi:unnamed protein product, partial [Polarella glacialis]
MEAFPFTLQLDGEGERELFFDLASEGETVKVGRNPKGDLTLDHLSVSWVHVELKLVRVSHKGNDSWQLCACDLSANGCGLKPPGGEGKVQWLKSKENTPVVAGTLLVLPQKVKAKGSRPE